MARYEEAICVLQDGKRITQKRIAAFMGISIRTVRRLVNDDIGILIKKYNYSIKQVKIKKLSNTKEL